MQYCRELRPCFATYRLTRSCCFAVFQVWQRMACEHLRDPLMWPRHFPRLRIDPPLVSGKPPPPRPPHDPPQNSNAISAEQRDTHHHNTVPSTMPPSAGALEIDTAMASPTIPPPVAHSIPVCTTSSDEHSQPIRACVGELPTSDPSVVIAEEA